MRRGMTIGWGTVAARVFSAASGAVLVVVLAGCSSGDSAQEASSGIATHSAPADSQPTDPSNNPPHDDPPAFHFESGDLVLGDFTYEDVAGNIFNPCEEISAEEFAAIGFESVKDTFQKRSEQKTACRLTPLGNRDSIHIGLFSSPANLSDVSVESEVYETEASGRLPGVYTHGPRVTDADFCFASVDTERGQFSAVVGSAESSDGVDYRCSRAVDLLEAIYSLN